MTAPFDAAVVGAGVTGCSTALFLARGGMKVALLDRGEICREASGVNAGTLTLQMTRAALIPYALGAHGMWLTMPRWCAGGEVVATACPGLSVAFTDGEAAMLEQRARIRRAAQAIEPGLADGVRLAGHCPVDGFASGYLTGRAFRPALLAALRARDAAGATALAVASSDAAMADLLERAADAGAQ